MAELYVVNNPLRAILALTRVKKPNAVLVSLDDISDGLKELEVGALETEATILKLAALTIAHAKKLGMDVFTMLGGKEPSYKVETLQKQLDPWQITQQEAQCIVSTYRRTEGSVKGLPEDFLSFAAEAQVPELKPEHVAVIDLLSEFGIEIPNVNDPSISIEKRSAAKQRLRQVMQEVAALTRRRRNGEHITIKTLMDLLHTKFEEVKQILQ